MVKRTKENVGNVVCDCAGDYATSYSNEFTTCRCTIYKNAKITKKFNARSVNVRVF